MKRIRLIIMVVSLIMSVTCADAQRITVKSSGKDAPELFAEIMKQSGKNFIYQTDLLKGVRLKINVRKQPLEKTLDQLFKETDIEYSIKGNNIILKRKEKKTEAPRKTLNDPRMKDTDSISVGFLRNIDVIGNKNQTLSMQSSHIGALNLTRDVIAKTPALLGESDVIKTLQLEPGVSSGIDGLAGMYVHGGNLDENLYMLDNIPLYQVNHFGGLFSAFNTEAIKNVDFYKSTYPAKFDGRLSSFMDVYTRDGYSKKLSGSARLGLTSGAINLEGPLWKDRTTFSVAVRRSWYDVFTIPLFAIVNSQKKHEEDHSSFGYAFTDINAKINHRLSDRSNVYALFYFGEDYLSVTQKSQESLQNGFYIHEKTRLRWGNVLASAGFIHNFTPNFWGKICSAFTRYHASIGEHNENVNISGGEKYNIVKDKITSHNNIADWIVRGDFEWNPTDYTRVNFGGNATLHTYLPSLTERHIETDGFTSDLKENPMKYHATELNFYIEDDLKVGDRLRIDAGLHASLFKIQGVTHKGLSPRLAFNYSPSDNVAVKGGYSRTTQYVHQLLQSGISLPTDQWVPITGNQKPQTADKVSAGAYWKPMNLLTVSGEVYMKWMHNLLDYTDEYYLLPPQMQWDEKLCVGKGTAKGFDFKVTKEFGKFIGHLSYSLLWADRLFANRNGGKKFPAKFDNRHTINIVGNWKINDKWEMSAAWTGQSGNRITLPLQCWEDPHLAPWPYHMYLKTDVNNFRLPFYHRLDLSFTRHTKRGYWTFGLYNAYCNMNVIGVRKDWSSDMSINDNTNNYIGIFSSGKPVFQKIRLIPTIPSVSYTWLF